MTDKTPMTTYLCQARSLVRMSPDVTRQRLTTLDDNEFSFAALRRDLRNVAKVYRRLTYNLSIIAHNIDGLVEDLPADQASAMQFAALLMSQAVLFSQDSLNYMIEAARPAAIALEHVEYSCSLFSLDADCLVTTITHAVSSFFCGSYSHIDSECELVAQAMMERSKLSATLRS